MQTNKEFSFKIGADPEFNLTMQNRKVDAHQTIEFALQDKRNFKKTLNNDGFEVDKYGNIGWDGSDTTAEIRPKPANTPQEVITNLKEILEKTSKHFNLFDMSTISEFSPIGGHIHFEVPKGEKWSDERRNSIHRKMSSFYLPVLLSENKINLNLRIRQGYGSLKDHRIEKKFEYPDGTPGFTYEFRCPSAEWMTTPKLALATLAYTAVIYHEILHKPRSFSKYSDVIYKSDKQGDALQTLAIMEFNLLTNQITNKIKKYIKNFEMYEHYKDEIAYIFNHKKIMEDKAKVEYNINTGWNLNKNTLQPKKREVLSSKKHFAKITANKNLDEMKKVMNIHYNDDVNVVLFAENLKSRVAAFNWKLKNNYFIFGIRKGIDKITAQNFSGDFLSGKELIKTKSDLSSLNDLFGRMKRKFASSAPMDNGRTVIDFKTGKPKSTKNNSILVALPYEMRTEENFKPFLELIWNIEKNKIPMTTIRKEEELADDSLSEQKGEIFQILNRQAPADEEVSPNFVRPSDSHITQLNQIVRENQEINQEEALTTN